MHVLTVFATLKLDRVIDHRCAIEIAISVVSTVDNPIAAPVCLVTIIFLSSARCYTQTQRRRRCVFRIRSMEVFTSCMVTHNAHCIEYASTFIKYLPEIKASFNAARPIDFSHKDSSGAKWMWATHNCNSIKSDLARSLHGYEKNENVNDKNILVFFFVKSEQETNPFSSFSEYFSNFAIFFQWKAKEKTSIQLQRKMRKYGKLWDSLENL